MENWPEPGAETQGRPSSHSLRLAGQKPSPPIETARLEQMVIPAWGHSPDYAWIEGELLHSLVRDTWRVRYSLADDDDRYGGSVTLLDLPAAKGLHSGQFVHIDGRLVPSSSCDPSPSYRVHSLRLLP